jgi:hypothetical protein
MREPLVEYDPWDADRLEPEIVSAFLAVDQRRVQLNHCLEEHALPGMDLTLI